MWGDFWCILGAFLLVVVVIFLPRTRSAPEAKVPEPPKPLCPLFLQLVSASADRSAIIWNCRTGEAERIARGHTKDIVSASSTSDAKTFVTGSFDRSILLAFCGYGVSVYPI